MTTGRVAALIEAREDHHHKPGHKISTTGLSALLPICPGSVNDHFGSDPVIHYVIRV